MPIMPGQGLEQAASPIERGSREVRQLPITVDGEKTFYPENYPYSFIIDGPMATIRRVVGGVDGDRTKLRGAIAAYLRPSQEIFSNTIPDWYNQTLGPLVEKSHQTLDNLKPDNLQVLGDDFRGVLERLWDFPVSDELRQVAAQSMGQIEGSVPTLSALIQKIKQADPERFTQLLEQLLQKGSDGFVMAAFLASPASEKPAEQSEASQTSDISFDSFSKIVNPKDYQTPIEHSASEN